MNFSLALIILTAVLTPFYILITKLSEKNEHFKETKILDSKFNFRLNAALFGSVVLLVILQFTSNISSIIYFVLYPLVSVLFLIKIRSSPESGKSQIVLFLCVFHLIVLSTFIPQFGYMLTERSSSLAVFDFNQVWNAALGSVDPYYSSFPMDLGFFYSISMITSVSYIDAFTPWIVTVFFTLAYDLVLYTLVKRISGSWRVAALGILLFAFIPPAIVNPQPQGLSSLFLLISILGFFEVFMKKPSVANVILSNFCFTIAILTHGTSAIGVILILIMFFMSYVIPKIRNVPSLGYDKRAFILTILLTFIIVTLIRWVAIGGVERIATPLTSFLNSLFGLTQSQGSIPYVPLYDQSSSPIIAFAWAMPVSMALAFMLNLLIYKKSFNSIKTVLPFTLSLTAAVLQLIGFLGSKVSSVSGLQRYLGQSSFVLFLPAVAILGYKLLKSSSQKIVISVMILVMLFTGIGVTDLAFSPQLYPTLNTINVTRTADYIEVNTLYDIVSYQTPIVSTYEILVAMGYFNTLNMLQNSTRDKVRFYVGSLKLHRATADALIQNKTSVPNVLYIWSPEIANAPTDVPVNVIYNSGRHVAVIEAN